MLDTHIALWLVLESRSLSRRSNAALSEAHRTADPIAISCITLIESARLIACGRVDCKIALDAFLEQLQSRFTLLPLTAGIAAATTRLPESYPRDPADRIIGATAQVHSATLITADQRIRKTRAIRTLW